MDNDEEASPKLEALRTVDILLERVKEIKFNQKVSIEINKVKVKFDLVPKGLSLGAVAVNLKVDKIKILYLADFTLLTETHITPLQLPSILENRYDLVITKLKSKAKAALNTDAKTSLQPEIESLCSMFTHSTINSTVFVINDISRIFEYILIIGELIKTEKLPLKLVLPFTYDYYVNIMKRLSEYMSFNISQNFNFDYYLFEFDFLEFVDSSYALYNKSGPKLVICSELDLINTNILAWLDSSQKITLIYENSISESILKDFDFQEQNKNSATYIAELFTSKPENQMIEEELHKANEITTVDTSKIDLSIDQTQHMEEEITSSEFLYFKLKNDFWEFKNDEETIISTEFGELLTANELDIIQAHNIVEDKMDNEKDRDNLQKETTNIKTKEFYRTFINFSDGAIDSNFTKLQHSIAKDLNYSYQANFSDLMIVLSKIKPKAVFFINNTIDESLVSEASVLLSKAIQLNFFISGQMKEKVYLASTDRSFKLTADSLMNVDLEEYNSEIQYAKVKFKVRDAEEFQSEMELKRFDHQSSLSIFKERKLLNLYKYFQQAGFKGELKSGYINFLDKVLIYKRGKKIVIEGCIGPEYYQIRRALYQYTEA